MSAGNISKKEQNKGRVQYAAKRQEREIEYHNPKRGRKSNGEEKCSRTPWERVVEYYESDDDLSIIELDTGTKIHVALPFEDLRTRMERSWSKYDTSLDLKDVTGQDAFLKQQEKALSKQFNIGALKESAVKNDRLILMYVYEESSLKSGRCVGFLESELEKVSKESDSRYLRFNNFKQFRDSWGCSGLKFGPYVTVSATEMHDLVAAAKQRGDVVIDLIEQTKPKGVSFSRSMPRMSKASKHLLI